MRAQYWARRALPGDPFGNSWVEAMEMEPAGGRFRLREESELDSSRIVIADDGTPEYDTTNVEIDVYETDKGE